MNILIIYAHHEPTSLTASLKNLAVSVLASQGHSVIESDLYGSGFSPTADKSDFNTMGNEHFNYMLEQKHACNQNLAFAPDILAEIHKVKQADIVLFYAPLWWFSVPAILKGWFDRVLAMGFAWDGGKIYEQGLMREKRAMLNIVAGGPTEYFSTQGKHGANINEILYPINHGVLGFCGFDVLESFTVLNSLGLNQNQCDEVLKRHQFIIEHLIDSPSYFNKYL